MNGIPTRVQEQADRADALHKEMNAPATKPTVVPPKEDTPKEPEHREEPPKQEDSETWKHKYDTLLGKYNSEVKPLKENKDILVNLKSQVRKLTQQAHEDKLTIRDLRERLKQQEVNSKVEQNVAVPQNILSLLTEEQKRHFEDEGIDSKTLEILGEVFKKLTPKTSTGTSDSDLEPIRNDIRSLKKDKVHDFWDALNKDVSDWEIINASETFNDWLDVNIPYTSITRRDAIQMAQDRLDHAEVIKMFNDFKASIKQELPKPKIDPNKNIDPSGSVGADDVPGSNKKKTYSAAWIRQFYADSRPGKYIYSEEERDRIDKEISLAVAENRITD